jgi:hypothetical protein
MRRPGLGHEAAGDRHHLLLAAGEGVGELVPPLAEDREQGLHPGQRQTKGVRPRVLGEVTGKTQISRALTAFDATADDLLTPLLR